MSDPFFLCRSCKLDARMLDKRRLHTINTSIIPMNSKCFMCDNDDRKELSLCFTGDPDANDEFLVIGAL